MLGNPLFLKPGVKHNQKPKCKHVNMFGNY